MNITKEKIREWLFKHAIYDNGNVLIYEMDDLANLLERCFNDLSPKWVSVFPSWPEPSQKVRAIIEHCKTGETKEVELDVVDDGDHLFEYEGCELSIAWDVIKWMPLTGPK